MLYLMTLIREPMDAEDVLAVTRAQVRQQGDKENMHQRMEKAAAVTAMPLEDPAAEEEGYNTIYDFHDDMFCGGKGKPHLTRSQRRPNNSLRVQTQQQHQLDMTTEQLVEAQKEDSSLDTIQKSQVAGARYYFQDSLLYRLWTPRQGNRMPVEQP